jgi:hypothetical protein
MASPDASALKQATTRCVYPKVLVRPGQLFYSDPIDSSAKTRLCLPIHSHLPGYSINQVLATVLDPLVLTDENVSPIGPVQFLVLR